MSKLSRLGTIFGKVLLRQDITRPFILPVSVFQCLARDLPELHCGNSRAPCMFVAQSALLGCAPCAGVGPVALVFGLAAQ